MCESHTHVGARPRSPSVYPTPPHLTDAVRKLTHAKHTLNACYCMVELKSNSRALRQALTVNVLNEILPGTSVAHGEINGSLDLLARMHTLENTAFVY